MSEEINLRRLWCLKTRGYHVFPSLAGRDTNWIHDRCFYCGRTHAENSEYYDPYTYIDDVWVYHATKATPKIPILTLRTSPDLTNPAPNPIVEP